MSRRRRERECALARAEAGATPPLTRQARDGGRTGRSSVGNSSSSTLLKAIVNDRKYRLSLPISIGILSCYTSRHPSSHPSSSHPKCLLSALSAALAARAGVFASRAAPPPKASDISAVPRSPPPPPHGRPGARRGRTRARGSQTPAPVVAASAVARPTPRPFQNRPFRVESEPSHPLSTTSRRRVRPGRRDAQPVPAGDTYSIACAPRGRRRALRSLSRSVSRSVSSSRALARALSDRLSSAPSATARATSDFAKRLQSAFSFVSSPSVPGASRRNGFVPVLEALGDRARARDAAPPHGLAVGVRTSRLSVSRVSGSGSTAARRGRRLDDPELGIDPRRDPFQRGERARSRSTAGAELERVQRRPARTRHRGNRSSRERLSCSSLAPAVENLRQASPRRWSRRRQKLDSRGRARANARRG